MRHKPEHTPLRRGIPKECALCGTNFVAYHISAKYCSVKCKDTFSTKNTAQVVTCVSCHQDFTLTRNQIKKRHQHGSSTKLCTLCLHKGENSPGWRGGCKTYEPGRFGRDSEGLSWKKQRQLAWVRDNLTCQHCGRVKSGWKPCVHHIIPWRISKSHAITNLVCLCRKCHGIEEAKIQDWGTATPFSIQYNTCPCGRRCIKETCHVCNKKEAEALKRSSKALRPKNPKPPIDIQKQASLNLKLSLLPRILEMREQGYSLAEIANSLPIKIHRQTIYYWCKYKTVHGYKKLLQVP